MSSCPHCLAGKTTVEIAGLRFHTLSDRWISCIPVEQHQEVVVPARGELISRVQSLYQSLCDRSFVRLGLHLDIPHNP